MNLLSLSQQRTLLALARDAIRYGLQHGRPLPAPASSDLLFTQTGACFVTLTLDGDLRGCIGSLEPHRPLIKDVCDNAFAAAFRDPRFPPLSEAELARLHIEVSVLGPLEEIHFRDEADLLRQIVPGVDGLVLEDSGHRGTFLPLVWEQLPDKQQFWQQLKRKAGLPPHYWSDHLKCHRYHTLVFKEGF